MMFGIVVKPRWVILFLAVLISAGSLPILYVNAQKNRAFIETAIEQCKQAVAAEQKISPDHPAAKYSCAGVFSDMTTNRSSGSDSWLNNWTIISFACFIVALVPFAWSFFLARLREVSKALRGID